MKYTHKIYETPELRVFHLQHSALMATVSEIKGGGTKDGGPVHIASKEFWGGSIFDEEDDEEYLDDIVP